MLLPTFRVLPPYLPQLLGDAALVPVSDGQDVSIALELDVEVLAEDAPVSFRHVLEILLSPMLLHL